MRRILLSAVVAAVGIGLVAAATGGAQGQGQGQGQGQAQGRTIVTYEKADGETFRFVDAKPFTRLTRGEPRKISAGDGFIIGNPLFSDAATTQRVGNLIGHCLATNGSRRFDRVTFMCDGVASLADGTVAFTGLFRATEGASTIVFAVTGGTRAYEGASGQITIDDPAQGPSKDTVHLVAG